MIRHTLFLRGGVIKISTGVKCTGAIVVPLPDLKLSSWSDFQSLWFYFL